ncbi:MAG: hypothetical protein Q8918_08915 [Bacteroidota bacterium]|nr:hypothetical protein [Bacteroidota bacterium]MDP4212815.1 hypothetical protein [Bacteroidota bacterium]MDP4250209.1 hypothetical protein [Bacteroidota bacterium]
MSKIRVAAAFVLISLFASFNSCAQGVHDPESPVSLGSTTLNLGAGPGLTYKYYNDLSVGIKTALEFGLWRAGPGVITLGGEFGISINELSHSIGLAGRSAWHYGWNVRGLDTYGGVSVGAGFYSDDSKVYSVDGSHEDEVFPLVGGFIGASYFLNRHFGFNVEAGYDISIIQAGIIFKLR